jgi:hypothetical protein
LLVQMVELILMLVRHMPTTVSMLCVC